MHRPQWKELPPSWAESDGFVPRVFVQPVLRFLRFETSSGIVMFLAAAAALWLANSALAESYFRFWESTIDIRFGGFRFDHLSELTVRDWVNDGLMAVFFFVVSLEIKRELVVGRLNSLRESVLPIVAAIGGMLGPAAVYLVIARSAAPDGWAIPVATDIAFALGFLALAGPLVPLSAKLFLLTMAIADDLGAIALIAIFYTEDLALGWIGFAVVVFLAGLMMERSGIRSVVGYGLIGGLLWVAVLESGVHATVAGVALAVLTTRFVLWKSRQPSSQSRSQYARSFRVSSS